MFLILIAAFQNCTDNAATFTVAIILLQVQQLTPAILSALTVPVATFARVSWVNPTTVDTACTDIVLPLNLIRFTLAKNGNSNLLSWSTTQEINTSYLKFREV
jgi:hypothetical protein